MTQDTRFVHLTAASKQRLVASARGHTEHVRPIAISNISAVSRMGQAATGSNFSVAETEKLPVRTLSNEAVFSIRETK